MSWAARISTLVALTNFAAYVIVASLLGGDAINGRVEGGRYYLAVQGHESLETPDINAHVERTRSRKDSRARVHRQVRGADALTSS